MKYRAKDVVVEARRVTALNADAVASWCSGAEPGDFIVKTDRGLFFALKPDVFHALFDMTFEVVQS